MALLSFVGSTEIQPEPDLRTRPTSVTLGHLSQDAIPHAYCTSHTYTTSCTLNPITAQAIEPNFFPLTISVAVYNDTLVSMASNKSPKNWVLTTSPSYSPGGALSLGQVLINPYDASSGLVSSNLLSIPEGTLRDETSWKDVNEQFTNAIGAEFHAWFNDASSLVAGAHADANHHRHDKSNYRISKIRSFMFQPSVSYVKQLLKIDDVPTKKPRFGQTRLYMVTGLRIAEGVSWDATASRASHVGAGAAGDLSLVGAPIMSGLGGHRDTMTESHKSVADISSFVFAYRLHEIIWTAILKNPSLDSFSRGSTQSIESDWTGRVDPGLAGMTGFQVDKVADQPFDGEGYDNKERMTE